MPTKVDLKTLGSEIKRLLGSEPVRFRRSPDETKFLLSDCDDIGPPTLCSTLAVCSSPAATVALVIDIDSLSPKGDTAASDAAFWNERLQCATRLIEGSQRELRLGGPLVLFR